MFHRQSYAPTSVAVFADRVIWTDLHFNDLLFHRKGDPHHRDKITVGLNSMTAILAVDLNAQLRGLYVLWHIRDCLADCEKEIKMEYLENVDLRQGRSGANPDSGVGPG